MFKTVVFDIHNVCCTSRALTIVTKSDFGGFLGGVFKDAWYNVAI